MGELRYHQLDRVTQEYVAAILWAEHTTTDDDHDGEPIEDVISVQDLPPEFLLTCALAVEAFRAMPGVEDAIADILADLADFRHDETLGRIGHDIYMTRQGHGCGFWDGDWPTPHDTTMDAAARALGEFYVETWPDADNEYLTHVSLTDHGADRWCRMVNEYGNAGARLVLAATGRLGA